MIETKYGIKIECKRRSGKIQLRVWSRNPIHGFNHCYTIQEDDADVLIKEIESSKVCNEIKNRATSNPPKQVPKGRP